MTEIALISLDADDAQISQDFGRSFETYGFAMIENHGLDPALIARAWELTAQFFALPEETKRRYFDANIGGARGYTPFKTEIAKGAAHHDLKEFWHVGRTLEADSPLKSSMPDNIWPDEPADFKAVFEKLWDDFDALGVRLLSYIAVYLGLDKDWFTPTVADGNSVMRLLHYPPLQGDQAGAIRAGAHEDINVITLLMGAEEAGLEVLTKDGRWISASPPPSGLVVNVGDMLQRLTNHKLPSTTHRVVNPAGDRAKFSRYSMPFFLHFRSDFPIATLPECVSDEHPNRYPEPILADDYLRERLIEIGLIKA